MVDGTAVEIMSLINNQSHFYIEVVTYIYHDNNTSSATVFQQKVALYSV